MDLVFLNRRFLVNVIMILTAKNGFKTGIVFYFLKWELEMIKVVEKAEGCAIVTKQYQILKMVKSLVAGIAGIVEHKIAKIVLFS